MDMRRTVRAGPRAVDHSQLLHTRVGPFYDGSFARALRPWHHIGRLPLAGVRDRTAARPSTPSPERWRAAVDPRLLLPEVGGAHRQHRHRGEPVLPRQAAGSDTGESSTMALAPGVAAGAGAAKPEPAPPTSRPDACPHRQRDRSVSSSRPKGWLPETRQALSTLLSIRSSMLCSSVISLVIISTKKCLVWICASSRLDAIAH